MRFRDLDEELSPVEVSTIPELARVVARVRQADAPLRLQHNGQDVTLLRPVRARRTKSKPVSDRAWEAALAQFGAWKGRVDPEEFKRQRRRLHVQPPRA
jgi:hypothetical protein